MCEGPHKEQEKKNWGRWTVVCRLLDDEEFVAEVVRLLVPNSKSFPGSKSGHC